MITPSVLALPGWREPLDLLRHTRSIPGTALLWSGPDGKPGAGHSILAIRPFASFAWKNGRAWVVDGNGNQEFLVEDPFKWLREKLRKIRCRPLTQWPFPGGAIGYFSYDLGRHMEELPIEAADDRSAPWIRFAFYDSAINWDHARRRWSVLSVDPHESTASAKCKAMANWLGALPPPDERREKAFEKCSDPRGLETQESMDRPRYLQAVEEIKRRIAEGECYEVNLSRRITMPDCVDPHRLFEALSRTNPAPFAAYMDLGPEVLIGSSPERFLRVRGQEVISSPIKGTAARHADPMADGLAASALLKSGKDRAENVMIVDLVRNDLGRVCDPGSVQVRNLCGLESFAGVHHLVSTIAGTLRQSQDALDAVKALFPPGSMTGAPKIAAMKVIEALEPVRRGLYAGAAGYLSATGDADLSVVIRSFIISQNQADLQVGGAVVADSSPDAEYQETVLKGERALAGLWSVMEDEPIKKASKPVRKRLSAAAMPAAIS